MKSHRLVTIFIAAVSLVFMQLALPQSTLQAQVNYTVTNPPFAFEDIALTGARLLTLNCDVAAPGCEESSELLVPGPTFTFNFFGVPQPSLFVNVNGTINFEAVPMTFNNFTLPTDCIPFLNLDGVAAYIAPYWDDLYTVSDLCDPLAGCGIFVEELGVAPNRRLIVQWNNIPHFFSVDALDTLTFEAILFENGVIQFQYQDVTLNAIGFSNGETAQVGIQQDPLVGINVSCLLPNLVDASAVQFTPVVAAGATRDFNGDGQDDILWHHGTTGEVSVWLMTGTTFSAGVAIGTALPAADWEIGGVGDFNADGSPDILWRNRTTGLVSVWLMNGTAFSAGAAIATVDPATGWEIEGVGDFNGDGNQDILWMERNTGAVTVWFMTGTAFNSAAFIANVDPAAGWRIVGVGDFNANANQDILWRNTTTGAVAVWLMTGAAFNSGASIATVDPATGWEATGLGDLNADGSPDILFRNTITGAVSAWLMNGVTFSAGAAIATVPDLQWKIEE